MQLDRDRWALVVASFGGARTGRCGSHLVLKQANAYLAGSWRALISGGWSPVSPFLLAWWIKIFHTDLFHRTRAVHLFSFFSLIAALVAFEYFLSVFSAFRNQFS